MFWRRKPRYNIYEQRFGKPFPVDIDIEGPDYAIHIDLRLFGRCTEPERQEVVRQIAERNVGRYIAEWIARPE